MAEQVKLGDTGTKSLPQGTSRPIVQKAQLAAGGLQISPQQKHGAETGANSGTQPLNMQRIQLLKEQQLRQARAKLGPSSFAATLPEILRKFAKYPPSLTFHIYESHYRFNNTQDSSIIPKDSPMARSFLQHLIREEIPVEMTELLKDFAVRFYDGCLVVQVYDHRNMVPVPTPAVATTPAASTPALALVQEPLKTLGKNTPNSATKDSTRPKMYRTLLRPTPQSLYYDLLYHTDSTLTKFTDLLSLQMEAEILTLTNRKVDLSVPLNPYLQDELLRPEIELPTAVWDEKKGDYNVVHSHREPTQVEVRKLHQDQLTMQKSSEYEEMMFLLSSKYKHPSESTSEKKLVVVGPTVTSQSSETGSLETTPSVGATAGLNSASEKATRAGAAAAPITSATSVLASGNATSNQFMRLRFIEEIRKRKESQKAQAGAAVAAHAQSSISTNPPALAVAAAAGVTESGAFQRLGQPNAPGKMPLATGARSQQGQGAANQPLTVPQAQQNQFQQNQQFQKQQQVTNQQRQATLYPQQGVKAQQLRFPATPSQIPTSQTPQRQMSPDQVAQVMGPGIPQDFGTSPLSQNARAPQGMTRQNAVVQNNQKLGQVPVQQQQLAKQADRIRAQQFQVQQARQQQQQQQQIRQQPHQSPQPSPQNFTQLKQLQQAAQLAQSQAAKRQKLAGGVNQIPQQNQYPQQIRTPQMGNLQQPGSNVNTPVIGNASMANNGLASSSPQMASQMPQLSQLAQGQASFQNSQNTVNNRPATQPGLGQPGQAPGQKSTIQQQQQRQLHQQIFQMTLTPQEQHTFRQLQARMNTLLQMSNTGVAPNRARLTAQQQQQALQQAKHIQQQLQQRFPTYFQRLRQYQTLQDERLLAMQRQQAQGQSQPLQPQTQPQAPSRTQNMANNMGMSDGSMFSQQNVGMNATLPAMQQQMMSLPMMTQMNNGMPPGQGN